MPLATLATGLAHVPGKFALELPRSHHTGLVWLGQAILVGGVVATMAWTNTSSPRGLEFAASLDLLYAVPAALLFYLLASYPRVGLARLLSLAPIVAAGEAPYAFYLIHEPIGQSLVAGFATGAGATQWVIYTLDVLFIAIAAWGIHVAFERPARRLLRRTLSAK